MSGVNWWITNSFSGRSSSLHGLGEVGGDLVDGLGVDRADHLARYLGRADVPLGVEREADVGHPQVGLEPLDLVAKVRAAGLDVEQQQPPQPPRLGEVAPDHRVGLAQDVLAVVARVGGGDRGDQLEHRQHGRLPL